ncbi:hypothetical protein Scep_016887 [Stephania cephalantha]|uniref:Uncharacterized protein n=1 Tax=Stephania cephalantha TaxID=152367 RepID=A0AAP0NUK6_9MAGN
MRGGGDRAKQQQVAQSGALRGGDGGRGMAISGGKDWQRRRGRRTTSQQEAAVWRRERGSCGERIGPADASSSPAAARGSNSQREREGDGGMRRRAAAKVAGAKAGAMAMQLRRGERRGGALSDRSILDEGCDSTKFDDAMEGYV